MCVYVYVYVCICIYVCVYVVSHMYMYTRNKVLHGKRLLFVLFYNLNIVIL
jgi:hypothetical protein